MREILFRGKRHDNAAWVEGNLRFEHFPGTDEIREWWRSEIYVPEKEYPWVSDVYEVHPETVGQYIGLTDRNGVMVYEGDILRDGHNYQVVYDADVASFVAVDVNAPHARYAIHKSIAQRLQVIGNIHDNPGLLTGGDSP